jgi:hypothetical protein
VRVAGQDSDEFLAAISRVSNDSGACFHGRVERGE